MKSSLYPSLGIGFVTSMYFFSEISQQSKGWGQALAGFFIQWIHDAVCLVFFAFFLQSFRSSFRGWQSLLLLNGLHGVIMILFCIYKRCVLTLLYNHVMDFPMCRRYVPIWQRLFNHFLLASSPLTCPLEHYRNTYMWLNNHILQSGLVWTANMYHLYVGNSYQTRRREETSSTCIFFKKNEFQSLQ